MYGTSPVPPYHGSFPTPDEEEKGSSVHTFKDEDRYPPTQYRGFRSVLATAELSDEIHPALPVRPQGKQLTEKRVSQTDDRKEGLTDRLLKAHYNSQEEYDGRDGTYSQEEYDGRDGTYMVASLPLLILFQSQSYKSVVLIMATVEVVSAQNALSGEKINEEPVKVMETSKEVEISTPTTPQPENEEPKAEETVSVTEDAVAPEPEAPAIEVETKEVVEEAKDVTEEPVEEKTEEEIATETQAAAAEKPKVESSTELVEPVANSVVEETAEPSELPAPGPEPESESAGEALKEEVNVEQKTEAEAPSEKDE
ncbi:hypothetical protein K2173_001754 [Erythroxylum novogranatense]|uniref:Uncharacterized protein n=1 Tax=Erythroxylum novogranatense TaxID=1862640 RepID=A0AAV8S8G7_9ROSI|nr:hypothetical protein K2173_001754 [Erythroxylum novogranatense]